MRPRADVPADDWVRPDLVAESPYVLLGDVSAMEDALVARRERWGLSYVVCFDRDLEHSCHWFADWPDGLTCSGFRSLVRADVGSGR
jgi:hypothetical protein